ncbi:immunoglobulin domain-containing family protein [Streptomyces paludis]|uniref:Ig-like domain-containing protein n=1 Tax=Streptomyces paludis TaxID=2282738 RepID=A0A345HZU5_9ACTN|nr:hypothetical protein [Streptomyces paludis]AXG82219.1 hypothetical protein DVK44_36060 [Streptomyces paludis]
MRHNTTSRIRPGSGLFRPGVPHGRRRSASLLTAGALVLASVTAGSVAQAAGSPRTGLGEDGQKLTVSASTGLDPAGETIRVTGEGYDTTKGIYVAFCKDNGDGRIPSPCLGGADMTSGTGSSKWIVPKGDTYEGEMATAYGDGGTFDISIGVALKGDGLDCTQVTCSVVTRVDHRASGDRSQDVRIPLAFAGQGTGGGDGGIGEGVPPGTVDYRQSAEFTSAGKPLDLLLHPDSGKLYVGADTVPDTTANEQGLYALDPADGTVRSHISQAPGAGGAMAARRVTQIAAPLAGDGVVFHYPLRGIGTAQDGDESARGVWLSGATVTATGPGHGPGTVLVQQGALLSEIETATGTPTKTLTLGGGTRLGVDTARGAAWSGYANGQLSRIDTETLEVTATAQLPSGNLWFIKTDPAGGNVWAGIGNAVHIYDKDANPLTVIEGEDRAVAVAFDTATGRAFQVWQDNGHTGGGDDNNGALTVYDTTTFEETAEPTVLPGNHGQSGQASVAVAPGGATAYVTSPAESKITKFDRRMSPRVTEPPVDRSAEPGDTVAFTAVAEGEPEPSVRWQVSPDGAQTWNTIDNATATTYTFTARTTQDGYQYRAEFTNAAGTTRTVPVTLTVTEKDTSSGGTTTGGGATDGGTTTGGGDAGGGATGGDAGGQDPGPDDGETNGGGTDAGGTDSGGTDGGTATAGGSEAAGGAGETSGTGGTDTGGTTGTTGETATTGTSGTTGTGTVVNGGGSLASTGVTALALTALAALLIASGWLVHRRSSRPAP